MQISFYQIMGWVYQSTTYWSANTARSPGEMDSYTTKVFLESRSHANLKVTFRLVVFAPFTGEVVIGRVMTCTSSYVRGEPVLKYMD